MTPVRALLLILSFLFVLNGCTQTRLKNQGKSLLELGRYEEAKDKFEQVIKKNPEDESALAGREIASAELQSWIPIVQQKADLAYSKGQLGRALLLYGKVAQLTNNDNAVSRYRELYRQLRQSNLIHIKMSYPESTLGPGLGANISGLVMVPSGVELIQEGAQIEVKLSPVIVTKNVQEIIKSKQYVSGYETVENPSYRMILDEINMISMDSEHVYASLESKKNAELQFRRELDAARKDLERLQLKKDSLAPADPSYKDYLNQYQSQKNTVAQLNDKVARALASVQRLEKVAADNRLKVNNLRVELSAIQPTVERPVYEEYEYSVFEHLHQASCQLTLITDGKPKQLTLQTSDSDQSNKIHALIDLPAKEAKLKGAADLEKEIYQQAIAQVQQFLNQYVQEQKNGKLKQAAVAREQLWVEHSLTGTPGVSGALESKIQSFYELELGRVGVIRMNELLALY